MKIAIGICTYKRPKMLKRLLASLNELTFEINDQPEIVITVVDNDVNKTAAEAVKIEDYSYPIFYYNETKRGISNARNRSLAEIEKLGCTHFIFVDDDEKVDSRWMDEILAASKQFEGKLIKGAVIADYDQDVSRWVIDSELHERARFKTGHPLDIETQGIANVFFPLKMLQPLEYYFDEKLALSGGEDVDLFLRLSQNGAEMVFCNEAIVYEYIPQSRSTFKWFMQRQFRCGTSDGYIRRKNKNVNIRKETLSLIGKSLILAVKLPPMLLLGFNKFIRTFLTLINSVGFILGLNNYVYNEYKQTHGQ
jgi:succinoglycan biosynthesis protein ExoM